LTKDEALHLLKSDVAKFNGLRKNDEERLDLRNVDLSQLNLKGADLRRLDLSGASFQGANLSEALLTGDFLQGTDFRGADLTGADFHHSRMQGADMRGAKISYNYARGRLCVHLNSFDKVAWDKEFLEQVLGVLNQNREWNIEYKIVPKK
jgi:hypothetical protein